MIRYADKNDLEAIINIWEASFPGDEAFIGYYFDKVYKPANTLLYMSSGNIAAMLQMLPAMFSMPGGTVPVSYIYGAATHPDYRRRGYMTKLIKSAFEASAMFNRHMTMLIPQEKALFTFYKMFGFEPVFNVGLTEVPANPLPDGWAVENSRDPARYNAVYEKTFTGVPHLLRSENNWRILMGEYEILNGEIAICSKNGEDVAYAFMVSGNKGASIIELVGPEPEDYKGFAAALAHQHGSETIKAITPADNGNTSPFGCARIINYRRILDMFAAANKMLDIELTVRDPMCPWENKSYRIRNGYVDITGTAPEYTPQELAELLFARNSRLRDLGIEPYPLMPYINLMHN